MKSVLCIAFILSAGWVYASKRDSQDESLAKYLAHVQMTELSPPTPTAGSIWIDSGRMASLSADYKAMVAGDLITITVVQDVTSSNAGAVSTARTLNSSSGISSLPGKLKMGGVTSLFGLNSSEALSGKSQASSATSVTTTLAGRVVAVLASGNLVIEAARTINISNEKQNIILRGVVRRGDIGPNNTVASNNIGDLELEIKGKGVISDGVRQPNRIVRTLLHLFDF